MQPRPVLPKKKKKKSKRDSAPIHMSLTVQWGVTDQKQSGTPPHREVLQTPLHPQLKTLQSLHSVCLHAQSLSHVRLFAAP